MTAEGDKRESGDAENFITSSCAAAGVPELRTDDWLSYYGDVVAGAV